MQCGSVSGFFLPYDFLNRVLLSLAYVIVRMLSVVHKLHKMCAYQLLTSLVSLLVNGRLLVVKFSGRRARCVASPPVVQGSCVYLKKERLPDSA